MNLTSEQLDVLNHVVIDGQAWADRTAADPKFGEQCVLDKIARHQASYNAVKSNPGYKTRAEQYTIDNPDPTLDELKSAVINKNQKEAGRRIALLLGTDIQYGSPRWVAKIASNLMLYTDLRELEQAATITAPQQVVLNNLRVKKGQIKAIQAAENSAAVLINAATTEAEVDAITVSWP